MECAARCRLCGETVSVKNGNAYVLGEHLLKKHPELEMTYFMAGGEESNGNGEKKRSKSADRFRKLSKSVSKTISTASSTVLRKSSSLLKNRKKRNGKKGRKNVYKTTVERWRPGTSPLTCPKCGNKDHPYIRKQRNKIAYHSLGAFFLLGCWPLCFLPLMMCGKGSTIICCKQCGYCFGTYDDKKGQLIPATTDSTVETPCIC